MLELLQSHHAAISTFLDEISKTTADVQRPGLEITFSIYTHILKDAQTILLSLINYLEK